MGKNPLIIWLVLESMRITLFIGQVKVLQNSNKISAIPKQLDDTMVTIDAMGCQKNSDKAIERAIQYHIASLDVGSNRFSKSNTAHWSIENKLQWTLYVSFAEDTSRKKSS